MHSLPFLLGLDLVLIILLFEQRYRPQNRQTSADFLVAVTDPKGRFLREGFTGTVPSTAVEFAAHWNRSKLGQQNVQSVLEEKKDFAEEKLEAYRASARSERSDHLSPHSSYLISYPFVFPFMSSGRCIRKERA